MKNVYQELKKIMDHEKQEDHSSALVFSGISKKTQQIQSISPLTGDASLRQYYRIQQKNGKTMILMKTQPFIKDGSRYPFLSVQKYLQSCKVEVPDIFYQDARRGWIFLEDLGDITLLKKLGQLQLKGYISEKSLYELALNSLIQLQIHASPDGLKWKKNQKTVLEAFCLKFDFEKLMWEVHFTLENFYIHFLKRKIKQKEYQNIIKNFGKICKFLAQQPTVLTHRDFHSRNIMVTKNLKGTSRCVMIDFQDARMGPLQYDLVSLLKDSYYQLSDMEIQSLIHYYLNRYESIAEKTIHRDHFMHVFDLMAIQRNFKAIGSFASFMNHRNDSQYLKYIGTSFENIRKTLIRYPEYSTLFESLFYHYHF